jgi:hypothetical protein
MHNTSAARLFSVVVGAVLVAAGILGFFYNASFGTDPVHRDAVLGILDVNGWHNVVHIATGGVGLAMAGRAPREYALGFGVIYLLVTILGFAYGDGNAILGLIPINTEDNILHLLLAVSGLAAGAATPSRRIAPAGA